MNQKKELLSEINEIIDKVKFHYVEQIEATGSASAIYLAKPFIKDEFFAVLYGDDIMEGHANPALSQLILMHEKTNANIIGGLKVKEELIPNYGIIDFDEDFKIKTIIEKPSIKEAPSNVAGLGRYIIDSKIFDCIEKIPLKKGEYYFTDAMDLFLKTDPFYACIIDGRYYDIGSKIGFIKCNIDFALKKVDLKEELKNYIK